MQYMDIDVADLMLDGQNPRHGATTGQREAIDALVAATGGQKLVALARDIVVEGLSPIDLPLVLRTGNSYTVLEGNRRIGALKVLINPDLAPTQALQKRFRDLGRDADVPTDVRCAVVKNRDEARHWVELRHTGENEGVGIVPWPTEAANRFKGRRGSQADKALAVIDALEQAFPANTKLHRDLATVRSKKLTTFGRLISDPSARELIGIEIDGEHLCSLSHPEHREGARQDCLRPRT
jgi:hypothetical protein